MKYFLVNDFGTKIECKCRKDIPNLFGYTSRQEMIKDNGGVIPDIFEISKEQYEDDDGYDVI